jgi:hypothetical protein
MVDQMGLCGGPDGVNITAFTELAGVRISDTFVQGDGTVLGGLERDTPPRAPREVCTTPATDN